VSDTSQLNAAIDAFNTLAAGFGQSGTVFATTALQPTATLQDILGCTVSLTVSGANAFADVDATAAFFIGVAEATHTLAVDLVVDGVAETGEILSTTTTLSTFNTPSRHWVVSLTSGNHTLKLQGRNDGTSNSNRLIQPTHTSLSVMLYDIV
jgi:hypothetical protein